ncbi:hypothetical protein DPMN_157116 [Dreissena polymorpha]|uniref:Uncharacterized protein n=1 Tax=Dreissena polymorpha TaxID=45954 RepID=A0A9D4INH8_DREPO|nr:hypothetical protein DPMN_157116 [Dreissena polymorpha]
MKGPAHRAKLLLRSDSDSDEEWTPDMERKKRAKESTRNGAAEADAYSLAACLTQGRPRVDCIVIREVQYQLEVNRCRNEEGTPGLVMRLCIVENDRIVIRIVQYQLEVNQCRNEEIIVKGNFVWVWPIWAGRPRIDRIVIREVQHQLEVNLQFWWGASGLVMGPCIVEIDQLQYQFEVNQCRNEEIIVKGNFGWVWSLWEGRPRIDRIVIRDVQYQFEFQGSSAYSVGGDSGQDGRWR